VELYRRKIDALPQALPEPDLRTEALDQLRGLIERIVVVPTNAGLDIGVVGERAGVSPDPFPSAICRIGWGRYIGPETRRNPRVLT
jgi:hypothetical protein